MYTITCKDKTHTFKRNFNTLSDLAKYATVISRLNMYYPNINNELTKKEQTILYNKMIAIYNKRHCSSVG